MQNVHFGQNSKGELINNFDTCYNVSKKCKNTV